MPRQLNEVSCRPFDVDEFTHVVLNASGAAPGDTPGEQVSYLQRYASRLGARTLVIEEHYVDRHFTEEFSLYYARCLKPPSSVCQRIHFFAHELTNGQLDALLKRACESVAGKEAVETELNTFYLGFVVIRPVPHVPIGRSILRPLEDRAERRILSTTRNTVHLLGLELELTGLAFQQQDRAVGACATAALWMAMSRAARLEGSRAPTPAFIAEAASRAISEGRPLPSRGLTFGQITSAVRECGFAPEVLRVTGSPGNFLAMVFCYLRSGIPVVLVIGNDDTGEAHAVTAVGYRLGPPRSEFEPMLPTQRLATRSMRIEQLYVHDDQLGPYARASLQLRPIPLHQGEAGTTQGLYLDVERDEGESKEPQLVRVAIIPVYPKLRVSAEDIWPMATHFTGVIEYQREEDTVECEMFFIRAGSYLEELVKLRAEHDLSLPEERLVLFMKTVALSRWVCVIRWWSGDERPLADFLYDTTDVVREPARVESHLLGMVALEPGLRSHLVVYGGDWGVPVL
ncbi:MAG TPA: hypothetical protein VK458_02025 [Myxococcaceae bacterium]|nr:hypothetical protein [Myxococcaceae bacterium]